ncbi:MAG: integration host factor subunit alpha, partial [Sphingomicrobium sp.]
MADLGIARLGKEAGTGSTLTRADLADVVHRQLGLSRAESASLVERVLYHMCHSLAEGQNVKISGFGSFILRDKGQRIGRNPKTGVEVPIAPRRVMTFR